MEGDAIVDTAVMRVLRWYEKEGDALIGEAELVGLERSPLQNLFGEWSEDPLYYACYPVRASHLEELEKYLPPPFLIDLAFAHTWNSATRSLECDPITDVLM
jgi:hypothetical protein